MLLNVAKVVESANVWELILQNQTVKSSEHLLSVLTISNHDLSSFLLLLHPLRAGCGGVLKLVGGFTTQAIWPRVSQIVLYTAIMPIQSRVESAEHVRLANILTILYGRIPVQ